MKCVIEGEFNGVKTDVTVEIDTARSVPDKSSPPRGSHVRLVYDQHQLSGRHGTAPVVMMWSFDAAELMHAIRSATGPK